MATAGIMSTQDAVTRMREDFLDDEFSRRWTDTQLMRALRSSLDKCFQDYHRGGGTRFTSIETGTTDSNGQVTPSHGSTTLERILWVIRVDSGIREEVEPIAYKDAILFDSVSGVSLEYAVPSYTSVTVAAPGATKLLQYDSGAEGGFPAMEEWVVVRAAYEASTKDIARAAVLARLENEARATVLGIKPTLQSGVFGGQRPYSRNYRYSWDGANIQLVRWS